MPDQPEPDPLEHLRREFADALSGAEIRHATQLDALRDGVAGELAAMRAAMKRDLAEQGERLLAARERLDDASARLTALGDAVGELTGWPDAAQADGGRLRTRLRQLERGIEQQAEDLAVLAASLLGRARGEPAN